MWSPPILDYAINNKLTPFICMQTHYSLVYREDEREILPTLKAVFRLVHAVGSCLTFLSTSLAFWNWNNSKITSFS